MAGRARDRIISYRLSGRDSCVPWRLELHVFALAGEHCTGVVMTAGNAWVVAAATSVQLRQVHARLGALLRSDQGVGAVEPPASRGDRAGPPEPVTVGLVAGGWLGLAPHVTLVEEDEPGAPPVTWAVPDGVELVLSTSVFGVCSVTLTSGQAGSLHLALDRILTRIVGPRATAWSRHAAVRRRVSGGRDATPAAGSPC